MQMLQIMNSDLTGLQKVIESLGLGLELSTSGLQLLDLLGDPLQLFLDLLVLLLSLLDLILHYYTKTDQCGVLIKDSCQCKVESVKYKY